FGQIAAAVGAQIHDHHIGAVFFQFADQALHVAGGAAIVFRPGAAGVVVLIEARHRDDADLYVMAVTLQDPYRLVRGLSLERHAVAREFHHLLRRTGSRARRQQLQAYQRAAGPANLLHDVVQAPTDHVGQFSGLAFADRRDAIVGGELAAG